MEWTARLIVHTLLFERDIVANNIYDISGGINFVDCRILVREL